MAPSTNAPPHPAPPLSTLNLANALWRVRRPKPFVLVIEGEEKDFEGQKATPLGDYLHDKLLLPEWREAFTSWSMPPAWWCA